MVLLIIDHLDPVTHLNIWKGLIKRRFDHVPAQQIEILRITVDLKRQVDKISNPWIVKLDVDFTLWFTVKEGLSYASENKFWAEYLTHCWHWPNTDGGLDNF